jgi:Transposase
LQSRLPVPGCATPQGGADDQSAASPSPSVPFVAVRVGAHQPSCGWDRLRRRCSFCAVPPDRDATPVRSFKTFTTDLHHLADWLQICQVTSVAMEATGVYWIPIYEILEARGIAVHLVNARHVQNVPGRKSDVSDCEWLRDLHSVGLLRGSFRPVDAIATLRAYVRHRQTIVETATMYIQRIQKALIQMNLQLALVVSDITGLTGLRILRDIIAGQRDPAEPHAPARRASGHGPGLDTSDSADCDTSYRIWPDVRRLRTDRHGRRARRSDTASARGERSAARAEPRMLVEEVLTLRVEDIGHLHGGPTHDSLGFRLRRDRGTTGGCHVQRDSLAGKRPADRTRERTSNRIAASGRIRIRCQAQWTRTRRCIARRLDATIRRPASKWQP